MIVYAKRFGAYFDARICEPTLILDRMMTEVYDSDFVIDAWVEPTFAPTEPHNPAAGYINALRDVILWAVMLGNTCRALKKPLVKVSTIKVYDSVGHGRRRGVPVAARAAGVGGMFLQAENLLGQVYPAARIYRAPILYGAALQSPINRVALATGGDSVEPRYRPEIESNEQMMLAWALDFVDLLMAQIEAGPVAGGPLNLWPYKDSTPLTWHDAASLAWPEKDGLYGRNPGKWNKMRSSTFVPDVYGEGTYRDGFRRYREEEAAHREKAQRIIRGD